MVVVALLLSTSIRGHAQLLAEGAEFRANSFTTSVQEEAGLASVGLGEFVVVWTSHGQDGSGRGVFAKRFGVSGNALGAEFQLAQNTIGDQHAPAVALDDSGGFVVVWQGSPAGIRARRFDSGGVALGPEFQVNTSTQGEQNFPSVAVASAGAFLVVWEGLGSGGLLQGDIDIIGQSFDSNGQPTGTEFRVNSYTTSAQLNPQLAVTRDGSFVVTWQSYGDGGLISTQRRILARRLAGNGSPLGSEFQVNSYTSGKRSYPSVAVASDGGFAVAWQDDVGQDGSGKGVFARVFDSAGAALGSEFRVNAFTTGAQSGAAVSAVAGGFVVTWSSNNFGSLGQDGDAAGVFVRRFSAAGLPLDTDFQVNSYTTGSQQHAVVATAGDGIVVAWNSDGAAPQDGDGGGIFGQRLVRDVFGGAICGDPVARVSRAAALVDPALVTASDSLAVLQAAVGLSLCLPCICDVDGSGAVTATDALLLLKFVVGQPVSLSCPACS